MRPVRAGRLVAVALLAAVLAPPGAAAQGVGGTVRHRGTGEPLPGVLVSVLDADGRRVRGVLTDGSGGFSVEVPMGRYTLRAERIGLRTETTPPFELDTLSERLERIEMVERAVEIAGIRVDARVQSCRLDPEGATRIQRWWSEIRTALDVSAALQRERFGIFLVEKFEREWDRDGRELLAANRRFEVSASTRPFVSVPAEELAALGYVQGAAGADRIYHGPDAEVLLSDVFLSQHCFSLVDDRDRRGQLGLRFEPVEGRDLTEIEGTLWVDTATAELQDLDFRYTQVEGPGGDEAGGRIVFDYLPSGAWLVTDWSIRMPRLGMRGLRRPRLVTVGYRDGGGSVVPVTPPEPGGGTGTIRGMVVDSLRGGGLSEAVVQIAGTGRRAVSDSEGLFRFFEVPEGRYYVLFAHPEIESWGLGTGYAEVEVREGAVAEVPLAVPGFRRTAQALCLGRGVAAEAVVVGHLLDPERRPLANRAIRLAFDVRGRRGDDRVTLDLVTDEAGRFVTCALPPGTMVTLRAEVAEGWVDVADFVPRSGALTYREIWFSRSP